LLDTSVRAALTRRLLLPAQVTIDYDNLKYFEQYVDPTSSRVLVVVTNQFGRACQRAGVRAREGKTYPSEAELLKLIEQRRKEELEKAKPQ